MKNIFKKAFTLIELLIVIAIIGILAALITTNLQGARERARDVRRKADLQAIHTSLRLYYTDQKQFPSSDGSFQIEGCDGAACSWGGPFVTGTTTYMGSLPTDPSSTATNPISYQYYAPAGGDSLILVAPLENESDQDIADSQSRCASLYASFSGDKNPTQDYVVCAQ